MRSYHDPVQVRSERDGPRMSTGVDGGVGEGAGDSSPASSPRPQMFVWRGRLYVVGAILERWQTRADWWRTAQGEDGASRGPHLAAGALEQTVWRVEAAAGRQGGRGVYELACTPTGDSGAPDWTLLRVAD